MLIFLLFFLIIFRKRKREEQEKTPAEEGEITGLPNSEDLDYLRNKRTKTDDVLTTRTGKNR